MSVARRVQVAAGAVLALAPAAVSGCGLGAGPEQSGISLTVTRDFGTRRVAAVSAARLAGSGTVMELLERHFRIGTRYGGGFVQSIAGLSGDSARHDWFFYVDGIEGSRGAGTTELRRGQTVWWDLHDWTLTDSIPAVVGSFPEPFLHGLDGARPTTVLACDALAASACATVRTRLAGSGVRAVQRSLTAAGTPSRRQATIVVGAWDRLASAKPTAGLASGPATSGVYVRFTTSGHRLVILDAQGRTARTLGAGSGLVAATAPSDGELPAWVVTGTDTRGVEAAAAALSAPRLHDRFALAVGSGGDQPVPAEGAA